MTSREITIKPMAVVLAVYALLACAYIGATPYRTAGCLLTRMTDIVQQDIGAPDERQHTNYVRHIADGKGLPVFDPKAPDLYETYQSHQPPLYYVLAAPVQMATGEGEAEKWGLRLVNVVLGGFVLWGIFVGVRRLTGSEAAAVASAAITGMLPMFLALAAAVSNDMALFLVGVALMNVIALGWEKGWSRRYCVLLGLCLGVGVLTKTTSVVLLPVAVFGLLANRDARPKAADVGLAALVALAVALPWMLRNQALYGDLLAIGAFQEASVGNLAAEQAIRHAGGAGAYWLSYVAPLALESFWGVFGYFDIALPSWVYWLCHTVGAAMLVGFGIAAARGDRTHLLLLLMLVMVVLAFVSYNLNYFQAQGRYLYPAIFAIAGMFGIGVRRLAGTEARAMAAGLGVAGVLLFVNLYASLVLLPVAFERMQECVR